MGAPALVIDSEDPVGLFVSAVHHGWRRDHAMWNEVLLTLFARADKESSELRPRITVGVIFHVPGRTWPETVEGMYFDEEGMVHRRFSAKLGWEVHVLLPGEDFSGDAWGKVIERLTAAIACVEDRAVASGRAPGGLPTVRALVEAIAVPHPGGT